MDRKRYAEIQRQARAKIAQRQAQEQQQQQQRTQISESAGDGEYVTFDNAEALMETLRKGQ